MKRHSLDLETALRVLSAIIEHREPDLTDLEKLRQAAGSSRALPADELAREVIHRAVIPGCGSKDGLKQTNGLAQMLQP